MMKKGSQKRGNKIHVLVLICGILTAAILYAHDVDVDTHHKHFYDENGKLKTTDIYNENGKVWMRAYHRPDGIVKQSDLYDQASGKVKTRGYFRADQTLEYTESYDLRSGKVEQRVYFENDGETVIRQEKVNQGKPGFKSEELIDILVSALTAGIAFGVFFGFIALSQYCYEGIPPVRKATKKQGKKNKDTDFSWESLFVVIFLLFIFLVILAGLSQINGGAWLRGWNQLVPTTIFLLLPFWSWLVGKMVRKEFRK